MSTSSSSRQSRCSLGAQNAPVRGSEQRQSSAPGDRAPAGPWLRTWLVAVGLAAAVLLASEYGWRRAGHEPSIVDHQAWWAFHRSRAYGPEGNVVALVGSSRMQLGFSTETFAQRYPEHRLMQLAVDGKAPFATLRDLANDDGFRGTVICSMTASRLRPVWRDAQQPYVDFFHRNSTLNQRLDFMLSRLVQSSLVVAHPDTRPEYLLKAVLKEGRPPAPRYYTTQFDRSRLADYTLVDVTRNLRQRMERVRRTLRTELPEDIETWLAETEETEALIRRIQDRGGKVAIVRFPSSGERWEIEKEFFPKAEFWDRFAKRTAATAIHFEEVPGMHGFYCPDGSHLDRRDVAAFTGALIDELRRRGVLPGTDRRLARND